MNENQIISVVERTFKQNGFRPEVVISKTIMVDPSCIVIITSVFWENEAGEPSEQRKQLSQEISQKTDVKEVMII